jgi:basic amino acid/polyamine antiporter, APA family
MSDDKILPPVFKKRHAKTDVLITSLSVFAALCILIIFWAKEFDAILSFTVFLDCFGMALSAGSIFVIRKKTAYLNNTGIFTISCNLCCLNFYYRLCFYSDKHIHLLRQKCR